MAGDALQYYYRVAVKLFSCDIPKKIGAKLFVQPPLLLCIRSAIIK